MAPSRKIEHSLLRHEEYEDISRTHMPEITALADAELATLQRHVRDMRAKERTLVREIRRGISGRKDPRGSSFPGNEERPSQRKQLFSGALKRINGEIARRDGRAARWEMRGSLEQALARKNAAGARTYPGSGRTAHGGMPPLDSQQSSSPLDRANVGRAIQTNKAAQAKKDNR